MSYRRLEQKCMFANSKTKCPLFSVTSHLHNEQELSHDSIARLNCALPITKTIIVSYHWIMWKYDVHI